MRSIILGMMILALSATAAGAIEVDRIDVRGNVFVSDKKIVSIFAVKPGDDFKAEQVSQGIKRLIRTKDFADVSARFLMEGSKAVIILDVEEYPRVKGVKIDGNDHIDEVDLKAKVLLREGFFARPAMMSSDIAAMKEMYFEKGYNRVRIEAIKREVPGEHMVYVTYAINEGRKVKIRNIDFLGNGAVDSRKIRKEIESHEDHWWSGGEYKPKVLEEDLAKIETLYRNQGYLDVKASVMRMDEIDDGEKVDLYIKIDEGRRYFVGDVDWGGNEIVDDDEIRRLIALKKGDPFSLEMVDFTQMAINSVYWEKGYIWSRVRPRQNIRRNKIDLKLD
ncbi:MAG TPA: POTRA domain-containing protein, partial [Candidatus Krumholzibacterium sp.]|nr:POTRA domain-containing protein [Candidatus Krumholzibacterium sp.]